MPLLHQDTNRGGGGSQANRRSLADFLDYKEIATPDNHINGFNTELEWRWEEPGSPEAAQTPRSLVPSTCFPPRHPRAYATHSESARPGYAAEEDRCGPVISDLMASLKALALPSEGSAHAVETSIQVRLKNVESTWPPVAASPAPRSSRDVARRASFCGVVPVPNGGCRGEAARWSGVVPVRCLDADGAGGYSSKVFLGGLPWDITEQGLLSCLRPFHPCLVEWPGRESGGVGGQPRGYAYVTFDGEHNVRALLAASRREGADWFYRVSARKIRRKEVQVIPWALSDSNWVICGSARLEPERTVFVGALHGMLSAFALAYIMNELFSGVVYAGIDTDKSKYPIGSGRVTFSNVNSYVRAIAAGYVDIRTEKFSKKIQVDPYLEDSMCSVCNRHQGPYFCRDPACFRYFCHSCWEWQHPNNDHKRLSRNKNLQSNSYTSNGLTSNGYPSNGLPNNGLPSNGLPSNGYHSIAYTSHGFASNGSPPSTARRSPPSDQGSVYSVSMSTDAEKERKTSNRYSWPRIQYDYSNLTSTPSPATSGSGASGASGSDLEHCAVDHAPVWMAKELF